ncbi:MAG: hypothetical protein LBV21_06140, partial [Candidatus Adiutrix sp.]|nr:hypothetical protein [Candidatus Adiutrix sp.]
VEAEGATELMKFLSEKAGHALGRGQFGPLRFFAQSLGWLARSGPPRFSALKAEFVRRLSSPEVLEPLARLWPQERAAPESLEELRRILHLLPPAAAMVLAAVCGQTRNLDLQYLLVETLAGLLPLAKANLVPLIGANWKPPLILALLARLRQSRESAPPPALFLIGLSRHAAPEVRVKAAELLLDYHPAQVRFLPHLPADLDPAVNSFICERLSRQRDETAEKMLLDQLEDCYRRGLSRPRPLLLNLYRALGRCASPSALDFLGAVLLKKDLKSIFRGGEDDHRVGAALALLLMPGEWGGAAILDRAEASAFRGLRQARRAAEAELARGGRGGNERRP